MDIEARLQRLEAVEAICRLKHRYFNACDLHELNTVRECFAPGPVSIDYEGVGKFTSVDELLACFEVLMQHPHMRHSHHGANPEIRLVDSRHAIGRWALSYFGLDTRTGATLRMGMIYDDEYLDCDGSWRIVSTRTRVILAVPGQAEAPNAEART
ncbi:nuclear transport factor 2 family protein [Thauera sp.]|uniref:nuclear transport factor 2 family protein n=1 Tax=Thauera sp. TaxID=1905334 RepID=UPI0039E44395